MKYLIVLVVPLFLLFSCDIEDDIQTIEGDYILSSYTKVDCEGTGSNLRWRDIDDSGEELEVTGFLDIKIFSIFKQQLFFHNKETSEEIEKKFVGAFTKLDLENEWLAEYAEAPFNDSDCEAADVTMDGDILTWRYLDDAGCTIVMVWERE